MGRIGIAVSTFNRNEQLPFTLQQIRKYSPKNAKIVVVDDGSKTPVKDAAFRFQKNQGSPIAKNKCLELLEDCEHIFLFDDDTFPIAKGWHLAYINAGVAHLNYSFKYAFKVVNGVRHLENPNGCMMYLHRSAIDAVGGFDTGFIKYGYWHGAYSNRIFNAGMTPHPFIDIVDSDKWIYCKDQEPGHRTATIDRGVYLSRNKKRYFEKLHSDEYIEYRTAPKVWYSNPYSTEKNIGKALNEFCELVPDGDWICLQDGDITYLTPDWGVQIADVISKHGDNYALMGCMTNRLARQQQRVSRTIDNNHDILYHYKIAERLKKQSWAKVKPEDKYVAGMFMLFPKDTWNRVKFRESTPAFDDYFSQDVIKIKGKLGIIEGLYVYHFYRGWSADPKRDRKHLK